ncbi:hypothetical protein NNRS527_01234 [Nitrosospira sp. NRS527]|nr:hypothetical protein NNRS527_01234 [Nitrosospira sp. NRS527]
MMGCCFEITYRHISRRKPSGPEWVSATRGYARSGNLMEKATIAEHEGVGESQRYLMKSLFC